VRLTVSGFVKIWQKTGEIFEECPLQLPPYTYQTTAVWIDLPDGVAASLGFSSAQLDAGLHAAAHALLAVLPLHLSCEPSDVGCECDALRKGGSWPKRLLLFDRCEGGLGISRRAAEVMGPLLRDALQLMADCSCGSGCWCCVHAAKCTEYNARTDKVAAIRVVEALLRAAALPPEPPRVESAAAAAGSAGSVAGVGRAVGADGDPERPSMLGRSIRRMWHIAAKPPQGR